MYDERTRYIQAYLGHLATVEKEKKDARMEEIEKGIETGKRHGIEYGIISLVKDGLLGIKLLSISVIKLDECMSANE